MGYKFLSIVDATYTPQRTDDLKPGGEEWLGWRGLWQQQGACPDGPYEGQDSWGFAATAYIELSRQKRYPPFCWVPECDLTIHRVIEEGL